MLSAQRFLGGYQPIIDINGIFYISYLISR